MRELYSSTGAWRLMAFQNKLKMKAMGDGGDGYYVRTPFGPFHVADFAGLTIFHDSCEPKVKEMVGSLKGKLFVDVGANVGFYSVMAAKNDNHVIAVEPNREAFNCLQDNIYGNTLSARVEAYNVAAWSDDAELRFKRGRHTDSGKVVPKKGVWTKAMPLDAILKGRIPSLIKIDAEGSEPQILRGLRDTLIHRPRLIFEALSSQKLKECMDLLPDHQVKALDRTNYLAS